ncbi:siderophore-interacting protein [Photobacterium sagamiensis]|uniref:siderophore-interacting protein n=1 Tax=Photobacterium sagamiensis TaxID=2910241 RepID=UPI003D0A808B
MKPVVRLTQVSQVIDLSPNLRRIVLTGDELVGFPEDQQGAHVKVLLPDAGETMPNMKVMGEGAAVKRSYTIRYYDKAANEIGLDFVVNRHQGPATQWACQAKVGDYLGIAGPGPRKLTNFDADTYLLVGDLTSVNAVNAYAQSIPETAKGYVIVEVPTREDILPIECADNVSVQWVIVNEQTENQREALLNAVSALPVVPCNTEVFLGLEARQIRTIKNYLLEEREIERCCVHATGYWKKGVDADRFSADKTVNPL